MALEKELRNNVCQLPPFFSKKIDAYHQQQHCQYLPPINFLGNVITFLSKGMRIQ